MVIQKLENKASQPPRICWDGGMISSMGTSVVQSSSLVYAGVIQFDVLQEAVCNDMLDAGRSTDMSFGL